MPVSSQFQPPGALYRNRFGEKRSLSLGRPLLIGRSRGSGLFIPDAGVSRHHCLLVPDTSQASQGLGCFVIDLHSRNGTYVNGQRIHRPQKLKCGDRIQFGRIHEIEMIALAGADVFNPVTQTPNPPTDE